MIYRISHGIIAVLLTCLSVTAASAESAPWGMANVMSVQYAPGRVVYDVAARDIDEFSRVIDRISYLNTIYRADPFDSAIVAVLHGDEIPFFAIRNQDQYGELMRRVQSLTLAGPIEFRMCRVAAKGHGLEPSDIHGFVKLVPMADAELIRLQREDGYAYMQ